MRRLGFLLAAFVVCAPAAAMADSTIMTPFGNANDPSKPVPPPPAATGKGIISATLVAAGESEVEERERDGKPLFAAAVDIHIDGGSTTPRIDATSVTAELKDKTKVPLLASCVPSMDDAIKVRPLFGVKIVHWNAVIGDQKFACTGRTARVAMFADAEGYHLIAAGTPGEEKNARMVLFFSAPPSDVRSISLTGVRIPLPVKED